MHKKPRNKIRLLPYKAGSNSARALSGKIPGCKVLKLEGSRYIPREGDIVINWGSSDDSRLLSLESQGAYVINSYADLAVDKLEALYQLRELAIDWTESREEARDWVLAGSPVYCRTILNGHSGRGIVVATMEDQLVDAPLYTKAFGYTKRHEYRVHVAFGEVILVAKKKRRNGFSENTEASSVIRNHHTGWVYAVTGLDVPEQVKQVAIEAVSRLHLDFGAVDLATVGDQTRVFEVNTAPGLEGDSTIEAYSNAMNNYIRSIRSSGAV